RGRADHARDPGGIPGHRARPQRALGAVARVRHARAGRGLSTGLREIPLARPFLDEREEELVLEVLRSGRLSLGPTIDRFEELVAVDMFGYPCELDEIRAVCEQHGLALIEDSAEALGAEYKGRPVGGHGVPAVFGFYPNKQVATGEGGVVLTSSEEEWQLLRS